MVFYIRDNCHMQYCDGGQAAQLRTGGSCVQYRDITLECHCVCGRLFNTEAAWCFRSGLARHKPCQQAVISMHCICIRCYPQACSSLVKSSCPVAGTVDHPAYNHDGVQLHGELQQKCFHVLEQVVVKGTRCLLAAGRLAPSSTGHITGCFICWDASGLCYTFISAVLPLPLCGALSSGSVQGCPLAYPQALWPPSPQGQSLAIHKHPVLL